jgi:hypothetical protein
MRILSRRSSRDSSSPLLTQPHSKPNWTKLKPTCLLQKRPSLRPRSHGKTNAAPLPEKRPSSPTIQYRRAITALPRHVPTGLRPRTMNHTNPVSRKEAAVPLRTRPDNRLISDREGQITQLSGIKGFLIKHADCL